ncbi:Rne/Rng family ribonuclease [Janibacter cremeus]|uniref:Ribonuclease E n=1 Tax=Janibacter cremeus TaxID=1285192 RepID=A0A852VU60_9MICO|nr:Rne/Rng family ribonuclease [Janibacter cremeus]NYF97101.1 ribonuclease E [Janibacter cremeus]
MAPENENAENPAEESTRTTPVDQTAASDRVETTTDDEQAQEQAPAATVPGFGLLFQPPAPVAAPKRRQRDPEPVEDEDEDEQDSRDDNDSQQGDDSDNQGEGGRNRRRRRGGRGRNRSSDSTDDSDSTKDGNGSTGSGSTGSGSSDDSSDDGDDNSHKSSGGRNRSRGRGRGGDSSGQDDNSSDTSDDDNDNDNDNDNDDDSGDDGQSSGSSRRRRRRRRGGGGNGNGGGNSGQDDPPGTVTKVRETRRTEPQAIKGSTRLEAKKQRRREGREAGRRRTVITEAEFLARRESVERVMVVRQQGDRTQIGVLEDSVLVEHYVSRETTSTMVGNVYLGRVQNVLPSMEAAFIDIGKGRNAVLYAGEVNWEAQGVGNGQARRIENALSSGDSVLVQVTKDPIGHKGARLTSQVSLPGRYLVYVPEGNMTGISRKLPDTERSRLKSILKQVVPDSSGVIVRTAAEGASEQELTSDVERLTKAWDKISEKSEAKKGKKTSAGGAPTLLHAEPDMTVRVIRDIFNEDFAKMVVSGDGAWGEIKGYVDDVAPDLADRLERWTGDKDVFDEYRIDEGISKAMDRKVWLPSGGSLVIDRTEAMTVVDVNTGKFTGSGGNLEETVTKNNIEAAEEIVRQLRLRDIGGIIVVDFIDMVLEANRDLVVRRLLECLGRDRTKHQVAEVTSLGLVQMTRKRVGSGLIDVFSENCEACSGRGIIVHNEPVAHDHGGNGGGSNGGGGKSRRGRGKGGGGNNDSQPKSKPEEEKDANGRTAAQIAAAAHAAAVKSIAEPGLSEDVATGEAQAPAPAAESTKQPEEPTKEPKGVEPAAADTTPEPEPAKKPARRRAGRRAASSAGAPVALEPVDLTAPAAGSSAPLTQIAGESGAAPTTPVADAPQAPATPPRRKRKRVVAQAGPPQAEESTD